MQTFFKRLLLIIENQGFKNLNDFALNGLKYESSSKLNRLKDEKNKPSMEILLDIANKFENINLHWLITGKGAMLQTKIDYIAPISNKAAKPIISYPESDVVSELKKTINLLNEEKAVLYRLLEANMGKKKT
jgi:hypothetical protein